MNTIKATIGERIENVFLWNNGQFPKIVTKYIGGETDNGVCYKDLSAWESGRGLIYISEYNLQDINDKTDDIDILELSWDKESWVSWVKSEIAYKYSDLECINEMVNCKEFIESLAYDCLCNADWQDLSTLLEEYDYNDDWVLDNWNEWKNKSF